MHLLGIILDAKLENIYNVILITELKEICSLRKPLEAAVWLMTHAN